MSFREEVSCVGGEPGADWGEKVGWESEQFGAGEGEDTFASPAFWEGRELDVCHLCLQGKKLGVESENRGRVKNSSMDFVDITCAISWICARLRLEGSQAHIALCQGMDFISVLAIVHGVILDVAGEVSAIFAERKR